MTNTVRWGILGTGRIARDFATALRDTPGATIAAVASRERATADEFADAFDIPLRLAGYDGMAACADVAPSASASTAPVLPSHFMSSRFMFRSLLWSRCRRA